MAGGEKRRCPPPHTHTHRGGQWGSLPTASMLRAPQHGQASRAAGGGNIVPSRDQEDEGEGFLWEVGARGRRRPDQTQAMRHSCIHAVLLSEVAFSLRLEKSKTREPCFGIITLPRPLWPLLGVGGWCAPPAPGDEARQAAARPRSPPRPASCPPGMISISVRGHPGHVGAGRAVTEEPRGGELITRRPPGPEPASLPRAPDAACCSSAVPPQLPMVGSRAKSFPTAAPA